MSKNLTEICLVTTKSITIEKFLIPSIQEYLRKGCGLTVICNDASRLSNIINCKENNIKLVDIGFPSTWKKVLNPIYAIKTIIKLRGLFRAVSPSIIHVHTPVAAHLSRIAKIGTDNELVYHVHGFRFHDKGEYLKNMVTYFIELILSKLTDRFININEYDYLIVKNKFNKKSVLIKGVGVSTNKLLSLKLNKKNLKPYIVGIVGTFSQEKGYEDLLAVAGMFKDKLKFQCFGAGNFSYFKERADALGISNIEFIGFDNNVIKRIGEFDLLLHPSLREGLPVAVMEAMCLKTPVITTNIRGCRDLIVNGKNGALYEPKHISGLTALLLDFYEDIDKYNDLALKAQEDCIENYDSNILAEKIVAEVLREKNDL